MSKALVALGAVAAALTLLVPTAGIASPVIEDDVTGVVTTSVPYADLNLAHPTGISRLRQRIDFAAHSVCGRPFAFEIIENAERRLCIKDAIASAQPAFEAAVSAARRGTVTVTYGATLTVAAPKE